MDTTRSASRALTVVALALAAAAVLPGCDIYLGPDCDDDRPSALSFSGHAGLGEPTGIEVGSYTQLSVRYGFTSANGSCFQDVTRQATWVSSAPDVAAIGDVTGDPGDPMSSYRVIHGVAKGRATIRATYRGKSAAHALIVCNEPGLVPGPNGGWICSEDGG